MLPPFRPTNSGSPAATYIHVVRVQTTAEHGGAASEFEVPMQTSRFTVAIRTPSGRYLAGSGEYIRIRR